MAIFNLNKYNVLEKENIEDNWKVLIDEVLLSQKDNAPEPLIWAYIRKHRETGSIATSKDRLLYMHISNIEIDREMLFGFGPVVNPTQKAKLLGARIYVELTKEEQGNCPLPITHKSEHADKTKDICYISPLERDRMTWNSLWLAINTYGITVDFSDPTEPDFTIPVIPGQLILKSELEAYKLTHGYNPEEEI